MRVYTHFNTAPTIFVTLLKDILTGLLGGCLAVFDEVIISTTLMNKIIQINDIPGKGESIS